jgi:RAD51-like protein 1
MAAKRSLARVAGLDVDVLSRLEGHNFRTAEDVLTRSSLDLVEVLDISLPTAERVVASVARNVCPKPTTARALLASRASDPTTADPSDVPRAANQVGAASGAPSTSGGPAFVRSHLPALDDALGGGVPTGSISELVGPAGAGKTQLCLTLAVATAAPPSAGGLGAGVVFVDTEQKFSAARLAEIARAKFPAVYGDQAGDQAAAEALRQLTSRVLVLTPSTLSEILQRLNGLEEALIDHGVRLLVVDSMAALARAEFGHGQLTRRQELLGQIAAVLKRKAERLHMAAFVTNQVTTRLGRAATAVGGAVGGAGADGADGGDGEGGGSTTAALGTKWAHCVNTRVVMEGAAEVAGGPSGSRAASRGRVIKVVKSPRCALVGFEYEVWAGGVRVDADKRVRVHPSGGNVDGGIRSLYSGSAL